ncbi:MAG: hypothetical protein HYZ53_14595 [Planctomycetes bacterium]|nr:hypothetical protein [Planctomycetota bacterium]
MKIVVRRPAPVAGVALALVLGLALGGGCDKGPAVPKVPKEQETPIDPATAGTVRGTVTYKGDPPKPQIVNMGGFSCGGGGPVENTDVLVKGGRVAGVLVYVKSGLDPKLKFATPTEVVKITNTGCMYEPRISAAMTGQDVKFVNVDTLSHNIHILDASKGEVDNFSLSMQGAAKNKSFAGPQVMLRLSCDVHGWMAGALGVLGHPYFAVTGESGAYEFPRKLPAGSYTVEAWHEVFGTKTQEVTLKAQETLSVDFTYP